MSRPFITSFKDATATWNPLGKGFLNFIFLYMLRKIAQREDLQLKAKELKTLSYLITPGGFAEYMPGLEILGF